METSTRMLIEWECSRLSRAFAYHLDRRNYAELAGLFTVDGVWVRHGERLCGRERIIAAMEQRPSNQFTRHVTASIHFTHFGDATAKAVCYNTSYFSLDADTLPARYVAEQALILEFHDTYENTVEGWRIAERLTTLLLVPDSVRSMLPPGAGHSK
jgi:hypothetical protein